MNSKTLGIIVGAVIFALVLLGLVFYILNQPKSTSDDDQQQTTDNSDTATGETATIVFKDGSFEPSNLTVKKGTTITVKNESDRDIQFSSADHPTHTIQSELNMRALSPGESDSFTITKTGTWGYHDHLDASKTGEIAVTE